MVPLPPWTRWGTSRGLSGALRGAVVDSGLEGDLPGWGGRISSSTMNLITLSAPPAALGHFLGLFDA